MNGSELTPAKNLLEESEKLFLIQTPKEWAETLEQTLKQLSTQSNELDKEELHKLWSLKDYFNKLTA